MAEIGKYARGLPGLPQEHADILVWNAEDWYYEDFVTGTIYVQFVAQYLKVS